MFALETRHREEQKPLRGPSKDLWGPEHGEQDFYLAAAWSSCVIVNYYQLIQVLAVETWFVVYIRLAFCAKCIFTTLRLPPPARMHNIKQAAEQFVGERGSRPLHCWDPHRTQDERLELEPPHAAAVETFSRILQQTQSTDTLGWGPLDRSGLSRLHIIETSELWKGKWSRAGYNTTDRRRERRK